jgi:hypothetical protein
MAFKAHLHWRNLRTLPMATLPMAEVVGALALMEDHSFERKKLANYGKMSHHRQSTFWPPEQWCYNQVQTWWSIGISFMFCLELCGLILLCNFKTSFSP